MNQYSIEKIQALWEALSGWTCCLSETWRTLALPSMCASHLESRSITWYPKRLVDDDLRISEIWNNCENPVSLSPQWLSFQRKGSWQGGLQPCVFLQSSLNSLTEPWLPVSCFDIKALQYWFHLQRGYYWWYTPDPSKVTSFQPPILAIPQLNPLATTCPKLTLTRNNASGYTWL